MRKPVFFIVLTVTLLFSVTVYEYFRFNDGKLHIIACDVGQGDSIFIRTPNGNDILIDGGPDDRVLSCLSSHMPFWDRTIETIVLTHPDADHSSGLVDVVERYNVIQFMTQEVPGKTKIFQKLKAVLAEKGTTARFLYKGDILREEDYLSFSVLWPTALAVSIPNTRLNEISVVLLLKFEKTAVLFTGDAGSEVMDEIAGAAGDVDILKVPHHGSKTGMSESFLSITSPELAVISVGEINSYGHPNPFSLALLKNAGVKTLRTDLDGEVEIISDGIKYWLKTAH